MKTKTRTEPTTAGDVEYQVLDCDGCEYEVALENVTVAVLIRDAEYISSSTLSDKMTFRSPNIDKPYRVFCPQCAELHLNYSDTTGFFEVIAQHLTGRRDTSPLFIIGLSVAMVLLGIVLTLGTLGHI